MTPPDFRAHLHPLISTYLLTTTEPISVTDELLTEVIAADAALGDRASTAALLRKFADQLEATHA